MYVPVGVVCSLFLMGVVSLCFLHVSRHNYPGGHAFSRLHTLVDADMDQALGKGRGLGVAVCVWEGSRSIVCYSVQVRSRFILGLSRP